MSGSGARIATGRERVTRVSPHPVRAGRVPAGFPGAWMGHAYLLYGTPRRRVHDQGVLLAGDAAGLAYPASGEGS